MSENQEEKSPENMIKKINEVWREIPRTKLRASVLKMKSEELKKNALLRESQEKARKKEEAIIQ